jgi:uncharacterized membrane protein YhiD involved in acid resistance
MASHPRNREREDERRRLSIRTIAIASIASATAAVVTSQFWAAGTAYAAAFTPLIVALVSELLHRPTEKIAERLTSDREGLGRSTPPSRTREPASVPRPGEPESGQEPVPTGRTPHEPPPTEAEPFPVSLHKQPAPRRRRIAVGVALATGVLAFAVAAAALTLPELIAGQSIGKSDRKSTFFGGHHRAKSQDQEQQPQQTTPTQTQTTPTQPSQKDQKKKKKQSTTPAQGQDNQQTSPQRTTPQAQPTP